MIYRQFGRTGIRVSPYCLGAMMFGGIGNPDHEECTRIIHKALDAGINFIDTADRYSNGQSEEIVGAALKGRRENVVIGTKVHGPMGADPNQQGGSRRWIMRAVEDSLRRLQTDYIDLYQLHRPVPDTDIEEVLSTFTDLVRAGKIRIFGTSTFPASDILDAQWVAERRGLYRVRGEQQPYSILNRSIERKVLPVCQRFGMGVTAWSPLSKGMLTGKYRKGQKQPDSLRIKFFPKAMADQQSLDVVEQLLPLAAESGLSLTHMALAFVISHPAITAAIIGPRTLEQFDDLLAGAATKLDDAILDRIDAIVPPGVDVAPLEGAAYIPPAIKDLALRRRSAGERSATTKP
jgi:aryl-alcohol dehydrogenase-like predicted oxidoreductase